jgi:hypothetical protein
MASTAYGVTEILTGKAPALLLGTYLANQKEEV